MALLNFQTRFVPKIEAGEKTHTIRAWRHRFNRNTQQCEVMPIRAGETLYLYTGCRQPSERFLMRVPCVRVESIKINAQTSGMVEIDGVPLDYSEREQLAVRDGFDDWEAMLAFWEGRLPFSGQIIHWHFPEGAA